LSDPFDRELFDVRFDALCDDTISRAMFSQKKKKEEKKESKRNEAQLLFDYVHDAESIAYPFFFFFFFFFKQRAIKIEMGKEQMRGCTTTRYAQAQHPTRGPVSIN